jgi:hypothetical protein
MKSFTTLVNQWGSLTNNTSPTNMTLGGLLLNDSIRHTCAERDWPFMQSTGIDFTIGDYTTGTITSIANGATTVTGSGTAWTSSMVGSQIVISTPGDNNFYTIASVTSTTIFELAQPYNGTTISAATVSYNIKKIWYNLPYNYDKLITGGVKVQIGSNTYVPREAPTKEYFDYLTSTTNYSSNYPEWFYVFNNQLAFFPNPSQSGNQITYTFDVTLQDLSIADYTTGTISSTKNSQTLTGSASVWSSPMAGRWIRIDATNVAASSGDNVWYQILSVQSSTSLTLVKPYAGSSIAGGTYTIGQMPILPEAFQDLPVFDAVCVYYSTIQPEEVRYKMFKEQADRMHSQLTNKYSSQTTNPIVEDNDYTIINPNLTIFHS